MKHAVRAPLRAVVALLPAAALLALTGCGDDDGPQLLDRDIVTLAPDESPGATAEPPATSAPSEPSPAEETTPATPEPAAEPLVQAARVARTALPGATVTVVERVAGGWEVTLLRGGGRELVVEVADGAEDASGVRRLESDQEDAAEARRLTAAGVGLGRAVERARTVVGGAPLVKVELDEDDGIVRYEFDFEGEDDVLVDARTAAVSRED